MPNPPNREIDLLDVEIAADFDAGQIVRTVALSEAITQKMQANN